MLLLSKFREGKGVGVKQAVVQKERIIGDLELMESHWLDPGWHRERKG